MNHHTAIAACFRNEAPYLREWIAFHLVQGVDHFYLYNNRSEDAFVDQLRPFARYITLMDWDHPAPCQLDIYANAISIAASSTKWLAVIDCDEFLFSPSRVPLPLVLDSFGDVSGVCVNWACYGPSGHVSMPTGLTINNYTRRIPLESPVNTHVKTIVRPNRVGHVLTPHHFSYTTSHSVDTHGRACAGPWSASPLHDVLRINHYLTRSREEWQRKVNRGRADVNYKRKLEEIDEYDGDQYDDSAQRHAESVACLLRMMEATA